jgi:hypothetical protein
MAALAVWLATLTLSAPAVKLHKRDRKAHSSGHPSDPCELASRRSVATARPRFVYLDLGANWANTLRLHDDIGCFANVTWEVYAFEPSPVIWDYLEGFTQWLNGDGRRPKARVPSGAGTMDLVFTFASAYGCKVVTRPRQRSDVTEQWRIELGESEACIKHQVAPVLAHLARHFSKDLNSTALLRHRLAEARSPPGVYSRRDRYTFLPAAAAAQDGWLDVPATQEAAQGELFTRPRDLSTYGPGVKRDAVAALQRTASTIRVPTIDLGAWLEASFSENDWIVMKIDAEGAEHDVLPSLFESPTRRRLIDVLRWECHESVGGRPCKQLKAEISERMHLTATENPERDSASERELPLVLADLKQRPWLGTATPDVEVDHTRSAKGYDGRTRGP